MTRWRWKQAKQEMNWKPRIRALTGWRPKKGRRTVKNDEKSSRNHPRKRLGSVTEAPRLGFYSRKHVFSPKTAEMHSIGVRNPLKQLRKNYGSVADLIFLLFLFLFTNPKLNMLSQGYGNFTKTLRKPRMPFFNKMGEVVAAKPTQVS